MNCLKCGRETTSERVFCDDCLEAMKQHPVSPDIPVILPRRTSGPGQKKAVRKKAVSPEEQITGLKNRIRTLCILLAAVSILAALMIYPAVKYLVEDRFLPGQKAPL